MGRITLQVIDRVPLGAERRATPITVGGGEDEWACGACPAVLVWKVPPGYRFTRISRPVPPFEEGAKTIVVPCFKCGANNVVPIRSA
jgi:hypothetical protein